MMVGNKPQGYTIVEAMIFLAISGVMFIMASVFISGKQASAEFRQGINDANSQIRTIMNDVINGYYPSSDNFTCDATDMLAPTFTISASPKAKGENINCSFLGKVIQISPDTGDDHYRVFSVAARQYAVGSTSQPPQDFSQALPRVIDQDDSGTHQPLGVTENREYNWGLKAKSMCELTADGASCAKTIWAVGFFNGLGNFSGGVLQSGSPKPSVVEVDNLSQGAAEDAAVTAIDNYANLTVLPNPNVLICYEGGNGSKASVTIGGNHGQQLVTTITVGDDRC